MLPLDIFILMRTVHLFGTVCLKSADSFVYSIHFGKSLCILPRIETESNVLISADFMMLINITHPKVGQNDSGMDQDQGF